MIETEIIKYFVFYKQSSNKQPRAWKLIKLATLGTQIFINYYLKLSAFTKISSQTNYNNNKCVMITL